jgi:50S ribosomal protein L16 3-hydroxylase
MLQLPANLTVERFLARHWQSKPLFMAGAVERLRPAVTRHELAWLATLDDVESRIVYTERDGTRIRYRAESGPFDPAQLEALPKRDWTLLVHDVEKHIPALRRLFALVPFIPDWRIDDLMVSFAAPGGGVGPHRDNYDVFLCQGIGTRMWHVTEEDVPQDPGASDDLALTRTFEGSVYDARQGDVLYLPPGVAHWGTAKRACITYSIGMRAPMLSDLTENLPDPHAGNPFYTDPDLRADEACPGYIGQAAIERAVRFLGTKPDDGPGIAAALGRFATATKDWLTPERPAEDDVTQALQRLSGGGKLEVHGMARIAWDDTRVYVNGRDRALPAAGDELLLGVCRDRLLRGPLGPDDEHAATVTWMLEAGAFEIPGN